ncbi:MAG: hypothetical protein JWQ98_1416 [Chlorobi bacterium]|nr:hypothetical protein [Chlorobiota bacterium]
MKYVRASAFGLLLLLAFFAVPSLYAQPGDGELPQAGIDTVGTALLNEYPKDYDAIFKAVKAGLQSIGYEVNYASKKTSLIETSFKQLANEDTFFDTMAVYGDIPYIRSPGWTIGRVQVKVTLERMDSMKTAVKVLAQLSGYEERFANRWLYWKSNGKLEERAMDAINKSVEAIKE